MDSLSGSAATSSASTGNTDWIKLLENVGDKDGNTFGGLRSQLNDQSDMEQMFQGPMSLGSGGKKEKEGSSVDAGAILSILSLFCWVAREVYGVDNPRWLTFRQWMLHSADSDLQITYAKYGPALAATVAQNESMRSTVKSWMESKLA